MSTSNKRKCLCGAQGQVLNLTSAWWMQQTQHLAANALLDVPDPNVSIMQRCTVFPVEFVVRGFLTGQSLIPLGSLLYCRNAFCSKRLFSLMPEDLT